MSTSIKKKYENPSYNGSPRSKLVQLRAGPAAAARRAAARRDGAALDEVDKGVAALARECVGGDARGKSEEGEGNRSEAHDDDDESGWVVLGFERR